MNKILIRLYIVKDEKVIETYFDDRLSFKDNFKMINYLDEPKIYDPNKRMFLNNSVPISCFRINRFVAFDVY